MKIYLPRCFTWIVVLMAFLTFSTPFVALAQQGSGEMNEFVKGKMDGEMAASGNALWIVGGVLFGCFAVLGAYLFVPNPPTSALIGKSSEYVLGYTEGYKSKSKGKNALFALVGMVAWIGAVVIANSSAE